MTPRTLADRYLKGIIPIGSLTRYIHIYNIKYPNTNLLKRISKMICVIIDIHSWISVICIVYIDIHVFLDGYPNPVLVL